MEEPNLIYIQELALGDEGFKQKIINIIKIELPEEIEDYNFKLNNGNFIKAAECVHKLKHKISILGLEKSYYLAMDFEEDLKMGSLERREEFEKILTQMTHFVNAL